MYKPVHFTPSEFVPRDIYIERGIKSLQLIDDRILRIADWLRDRYGGTTINNWQWGGDREWSGLRTPDSPYYSRTSQHTFGRAIDCIFNDYTAEEVRQDLKASMMLDDLNIDSVTLEDGVGWLHADVRNNEAGFNYFNP